MRLYYTTHRNPRKCTFEPFGYWKLPPHLPILYNKKYYTILLRAGSDRMVPALRILFMLTLAIGWSQSNSSRAPKFESYPEHEVYVGGLATPKYSPSMEVRYKREIRNNYVVETKPNFAGHFVLLHWSCGSACIEMAIVDAKSGDIYSPPITDEGIGIQRFFLPYLTHLNGGSSGPILQFKPDSRLFIIKCNHGNEWKGYTYYFLWKQNKWELLRRAPLIEK
jgi:hypothetical protein